MVEKDRLAQCVGLGKEVIEGGRQAKNSIRVSSEPGGKSNDILGAIRASGQELKAISSTYVPGTSGPRKCVDRNILVGFVAEDFLADAVTLARIE
jgi:hypothetical protein